MERAALVAGASTRSHSNSMIILIMLIALNLRPFLPMVSDDTGISYGALPLPTILPMLIFGAFIAVALGPFPRGLRFPDHHGPAIPCCADPHRDRKRYRRLALSPDGSCRRRPVLSAARPEELRERDGFPWRLYLSMAKEVHAHDVFAERCAASHKCSIQV